MIKPGFVSITFRNLKPEEIVDLVVKAKLSAIEWGGDVHVPHGRLDIAKQVQKITLDNGLQTACYGSYYKVASEDQSLEFQTVLDTAIELGAPAIRVWAGDRGSTQANSEYWETLIDEAIVISDIAGGKSIKIYVEFHDATITDKVESTIRLLKAVNSDNLKILWQPRHNVSVEDNFIDLGRLKPWLSNFHVFHWWPDHERHPLETGFDPWSRFLGSVAGDNIDRYALLEFVKDDSPEQFLEDARTLRRIIQDG